MISSKTSKCQEILKLLLQHGGDLFEPDNGKITPLDLLQLCAHDDASRSFYRTIVQDFCSKQPTTYCTYYCIAKIYCNFMNFVIRDALAKIKTSFDPYITRFFVNISSESKIIHLIAKTSPHFAIIIFFVMCVGFNIDDLKSFKGMYLFIQHTNKVHNELL